MTDAPAECWKAEADALRRIVLDALVMLERDLADDLRSCCIADEAGNPIRSTVDPDDEFIISEREAMIARMRAALGVE